MSMPSTVDINAPSKKRKGDEIFRSPSKDKPNDEGMQARILELEDQILKSRRHYNNITILLAFAQDDARRNEEAVFAAVSLCRVFCRLMASGATSKLKGSTDGELTIVQWLQERYEDYVNALVSMLKRSDNGQGTALTLLLRLVKDEGTHIEAETKCRFPEDLLSRIIKTLLEGEDDTGTIEELVEKYVNQYDDIRYYALTAIQRLASEYRKPDKQKRFSANLLTVLSSIKPPPSSRDDPSRFYILGPTKSKHRHYSPVAHRKQLQQAWLALFKLGLTKEQRKTVLSLVSSQIAPCFVKVELLMDFLTDAFDVGGATSLLALSGLFYLIQEKNLDYPMFYCKLYSLLDTGILHSRHRSRFFRLLDTFLASAHLPAALVASFIKRLSRLSLYAPPAGIVAAIPWIYNLLKRHPTCTFMIHREINNKDEIEKLGKDGMGDPFDMREENPMKTGAIESSLWEIETLQSHSHPNVATLARVISEQFTKHAYNIEDFLDHSYGTMLDMEFSKGVKNAPVVEYEIAKTIFTQQEGADNPLVTKLWNFSQL